MLSWARNTFELQAGDRSRLLPMEGLRGFAVILVFLHHYSVQAQSIGLPPGPAAVTAAALHNYGNVGVELFFTLSGFLIYGTLVRHAPPFGSFMARRIQRIYPAYLAVLLFALALSVFGPGTRLLANPVHAIPLVLANVALLPGLFPIPPIVAVAWSLSYELFFYVAIAAVVLGAGLGVRSRGYRLTLLAGASLLFTIAGFAELPGYPIRMMPFFAGMFLAEGVGARIPGWLALVAAIAGFLASATHAFGDVLGEIVQTLVFFALCAVCFRGTGRVASVFAWTPLRWLGNMSYSYYLIHGFVVRVAMLMLGAALPTGMPEWVFWAVLPLLFGATLVVAALLFVLIEKPYSLRPAASKVTQPALI